MTQIQLNYQTELTSPRAELVANLKFNEGSGPTAFDTAGAVAQNASLLGGATWSTTDMPNGTGATATPTSTPGGATATPTLTCSHSLVHSKRESGRTE